MSPEPSATSTPTPILLYQKGDIRRTLAGGGPRRQSMAGFDEKFTDIIDYILRITHEIWEEKGFGRIYDYYGYNCPVHTTEGTIYGREAVMAGTVATLAAFPDRRLYGDEVIWAGDDVNGFYTSHRLTHMGRNTGYSSFGPPTGRQVRYTAIADCVVRENVIVEEWLARDNVMLVRQLGFEPLALAREMAAQEAAAGIRFEHPGEVERVLGQGTPVELPPPPTEFEIEDFMRRILHQIWNWRLLNVVDTAFAPSYSGQFPSGRSLYGRGDYQAFVLAMLAAFPDAALTVDHFCALADGPDAYRTATRWTLQGSHLGPGVYGAPTGKRIRLMGMSHHLLHAGRIVREWTVFDEFALMKRLFAPD